MIIKLLKIKQPIVFMFVVFIFLTQLNLFCKQIENIRKKSLKNLDFTYIIPGVEQLKRGYYLKGGLLFTSFITTLTGAVIENKKGNDFYDIYINSKNIDEIVKSRLDAENHFKKRNYYIIGGVSIWIINLIDLNFFSKKQGIKGEIKKDYISFGFYYIF